MRQIHNNAVLGLLADNGRISGGSIVEGRDITDLPPRDGRFGPRIATVFQDPMGALNPVLAVGRQMRNIQYRTDLSNQDRRSAEMLARVRIPEPPMPSPATRMNSPAA